MKTTDINIRDSYILVHEGKYYLYGTRANQCWSEIMDGFDCYVSSDMESWEGPVEIFRRPDDFFATKCFWAPECYEYEGGFYLVTTFGGPDFKQGIYILKSEYPDGPFELYSKRLTPEEWTSIDGTLYFEDGTPWLVFSHSFEDLTGASICAVKLSLDLSHCVSEPEILFYAKEAEWAKPVPFAKEEFGIDGDVYFTDGPNLRRINNTLYMIWSSWGTAGYAIGVAVSKSGNVKGPWEQRPCTLWPENGGHGMMFEDKGGRLMLALHYPNDKFAEKPCFCEITEKDGSLVLK